jgi:hypothetical protein
MGRIVAAIIALHLLVLTAATDGQAPPDRDATLKHYGLDPSTPIESRVRQPSPEMFALFGENPRDRPSVHILTEAERRAFSAALDALPPLHHRVLQERLRAISFLDGMPNTALTMSVNADEPYQVFDMIVRATVFDENVSQWLTAKERTCFDMTGSSRTVTIEAGTLDAIRYALLHEATHVADQSLVLTPPRRRGGPTPDPDIAVFTRGVWSTPRSVAPRYRDPLLEHTKFRMGGSAIPIARAEQLYDALRRTPFASLYGSANWADDLAEYVALFHWTEKLGQPYRIVVRDGAREVMVYEPMKSELVRSRSEVVKQFYEPGA